MHKSSFSRLATGLVGLTGIRTPDVIKAIENAAAAISGAVEEEWSVDTTRRILEVAGALPAPTHVVVAKLEDEGGLVIRSVAEGTPKARQMRYVKGSARPHISLLGPLRELNISVPKGMKLLVPVTLVQDSTGLAAVVSFKRSQLKAISDRADTEE